MYTKVYSPSLGGITTRLSGCSEVFRSRRHARYNCESEQRLLWSREKYSSRKRGWTAIVLRGDADDKPGGGITGKSRWERNEESSRGVGRSSGRAECGISGGQSRVEMG